MAFEQFSIILFIFLVSAILVIFSIFLTGGLFYCNFLLAAIVVSITAIALSSPSMEAITLAKLFGVKAILSYVMIFIMGNFIGQYTIFDCMDDITGPRMKTVLFDGFGTVFLFILLKLIYFH